MKFFIVFNKFKLIKGKAVFRGSSSYAIVRRRKFVKNNWQREKKKGNNNQDYQHKIFGFKRIKKN